ncbi:MAG TPA: hypothetical protein VM260_26990 [Pirellula sp.]|nr:hypothetical protein [Pirellula sp.]
MAIWSERRIGELIVESKVNGTIKQGRNTNAKLPSDSASHETLQDMLGTVTDVEARQIASRSSRLAEHTIEAVTEAIEAIFRDHYGIT